VRLFIICCRYCILRIPIIINWICSQSVEWIYFCDFLVLSACLRVLLLDKVERLRKLSINFQGSDESLFLVSLPCQLVVSVCIAWKYILFVIFILTFFPCISLQNSQNKNSKNYFSNQSTKQFTSGRGLDDEENSICINLCVRKTFVSFH
jgi:hypothetical protein